jgi:hypothetical protein
MAISSEAFAVEQADMSEFSDASDDIIEMSEMKEFFDNMETEVCNHYFILNKSKVQSHTTDSTVLKLKLTVKIQTSSFDDITLQIVLLGTGCTKTLIKVKFIPARYFKMHQKPNEIL